MFDSNTKYKYHTMNIVNLKTTCIYPNTPPYILQYSIYDSLHHNIIFFSLKCGCLINHPLWLHIIRKHLYNMFFNYIYHSLTFILLASFWAFNFDSRELPILILGLRKIYKSKFFFQNLFHYILLLAILTFYCSFFSNEGQFYNKWEGI